MIVGCDSCKWQCKELEGSPLCTECLDVTNNELSRLTFPHYTPSTDDDSDACIKCLYFFHPSELTEGQCDSCRSVS